MRSVFLKDMAYRKARVVLTTIGIFVLVALILLLGGIMNGLRWQARRYFEFTGADIWIAKQRSGGVAVGFSLLNPEYVIPAIRDPGIDQNVPISPLIFAQARPVVHSKETKAVVVGYQIGRLGGPRQEQLSEGRLFIPTPGEYSPEQQLAPAEVVISDIGVFKELGIGETINVGGKTFRVVGKVKDLFFVFDTPFLFMDIRSAQDAVLLNSIFVNTFLAKVTPQTSHYVVGSGNESKLTLEQFVSWKERELSQSEIQNLINNGQVKINGKRAKGKARLLKNDKIEIVRNTPAEVAARLDEFGKRLGLEVRSKQQTIDTILENYVDEPMKAVRFFQVMLWLVAGIIVGLITYATTLEKVQEIGVLKAIGASGTYVMSMTLKQVALMSVIGLLLGIGLISFAVHVFPIFVLISVPETVAVSMMGLVVCCLGGCLAAWKAVSVDPMIAFRGEI
ncbi:TPA: ABC transporter permease [Candidatus Poribacteria bacterium]|nr:ABC transporter permease [Candidatus Poribacteria bacterium]